MENNLWKERRVKASIKQMKINEIEQRHCSQNFSTGNMLFAGINLC